MRKKSIFQGVFGFLTLGFLFQLGLVGMPTAFGQEASGSESGDPKAATAESKGGNQGQDSAEEGDIMGIEAHMKTTKGTIVLTLFPEDAPVTVANFVNLSNRGFYDGITFHRVIADFMIQGGDPTGTGRGGPGYRFEDEFQSGRKFDKKGLLAMANAGPGTNGSQFFITHVPTPHLNNRHTIFGEVKKGQDVVDSIEKGDKIETVDIKGETEEFLASMKDRIEAWNAVLDRNKK